MSIAQTLIPDVLELIAEHLDDSPERRKEGASLDKLHFALVCKGWRDVGLEALYRNLDFRQGGFDGAVRALRMQPPLRQHVLCLRVLLNGGRLESALLVQALPRLNKLDVVGISYSGFDALKKVRTGLSVPRLRELRVAPQGGLEHDAADLFALLEAATALRSFTLLSSDRTLSTPTSFEPPFRLTHLGLVYSSLPNDPPTPHTRHLLLASFDLSSLRSFDANFDSFDSRFYEGLTAAKNSRSLALEPGREACIAALEPLSTILPKLPHLCILALKSRPPQTVHSRDAASSTIRTFLSSFPPTLRRLDIDLAFVGGAAHPVFASFLDSRRIGALLRVKAGCVDEEGYLRGLSMEKAKDEAWKGDENDPQAWTWCKL